MATLYDAHGNKVDTKLLRQELAAPGLGSVRQVISDHPSSGLTPRRLANLLRASECGDAKSYLELAEDMEEKYLHYGAQIRTRKLACAGLEIVVKAAGDDNASQAAAGLVRDVITGLPIQDIITDALDGLCKGYSVLEILWDITGKNWIPGSIVWRDPRWFRYDIHDGTTLLLIDGGLGIPLAPYKFIYHRPRLKSGLPIKGGLARAAAWSFLFSSYVLKDWVGFCEVFGQPIRVGKYPAGSGEDQISVLKAAVGNIGTDCAAVIPDGMLIEFIEASTKGATGELYERLCRYLDERVSVAVLGQTLTSGQTQGGGGSMALGKVHNDVRYDLLEADARQLSATLTVQLARPLVDLNLGPQDIYPQIELFIKKPEDLSSLADQLSKLVPLGLRVDAGEIRGKFGLTDPEEGAEILAARSEGFDASSAFSRQTTQTSDTCKCSCHRRSAHKTDQVDAMSDQLESLAADALEKLWEPVKSLVLRAESYEEIEKEMAAMFRDMDDETFAEWLNDALTAAALLGAQRVFTTSSAGRRNG